MTSRVLVALRVEAPPARVFEAFTAEIARWWRPSGLFQTSRPIPGRLVMEAGPGGRLLEVHADGGADEVAHVVTWEPPTRLVLRWRPTSFAPDQATEVHVRFEPVDHVTRVVVEHLGWDRIPREHAARHGMDLATFQRRLAEWWQALLASLAAWSAGPP